MIISFSSYLLSQSYENIIIGNRKNAERIQKPRKVGGQVYSNIYCLDWRGVI